MAAAQRVGGSGSLYFRASPGQCPRLRCRPEHRAPWVCVWQVGWGVVVGCLRCLIIGPLGGAKQRMDRVLGLRIAKGARTPQCRRSVF